MHIFKFFVLAPLFLLFSKLKGEILHVEGLCMG